MIVSYEMLLRCFDEIQQVNFDLVVCDEGHRLKNAGNKTSSVLNLYINTPTFYKNIHEFLAAIATLH